MAQRRDRSRRNMLQNRAAYRKIRLRSQRANCAHAAICRRIRLLFFFLSIFDLYDLLVCYYQ